MQLLRRAQICALLLTVAISGCKPKPPVPVIKKPDGTVIATPPPPKEEEEDAAKSLAAQAKAQADAGNQDEARATRDQILEKYPATAAAAVILHARAMKARDEGNIQEAIDHYEKLLVFRPNYVRGPEAREDYAKLLIKADRNADAANMLRALYKDTTDPEARSRIGELLGKALEGLGGAGMEALRVQVALMDQGTEDERRKAKATALDVIARELSMGEAQQLWEDVKNDGDWAFAQPLLAFKLAKIYYHTREYKKSETMLKLTADRYPTSEYGTRAKEFLERLQDRFMVEPKTIGVLLPLSGRLQQFGERSLAAIKLAFGSSSPYKLVVKDTKGKPTVAAQAVEQLVLEHHALAIIGPQFSATGMAAASKAEELSVPLVALSHGEGLADVGDYIFRPALTVSAQARALAKVAFEQLEYKRFAVLYPETAYGRTFLDAFWDEVNRRKGEIKGVESYGRSQTTFSIPVRKLVGRYFLNSRWDYYAELRKIRARRLPSHREQAEVEDMKQGLPPIVDFDAILIPDSGKRIGLLAPALAFEDIVLTTDRKQLETISKALGYDPQPVTLLGGSGWNNEDTVLSCGRHCEKSIFVDGYYSDNPSPKARDFISLFRGATGGAEPQLSDAEAFDAAHLLKRTLEGNNPTSRQALQKALLGMPIYEGVTGKIRFSENGEPDKDLFVLTIDDSAIRRWEAPKPPATN